MLAHCVMGIGENLQYAKNRIGGVTALLIAGVASTGKSKATELVHSIYCMGANAITCFNDWSNSALVHAQKEYPGILLGLSTIIFTVHSFLTFFCIIRKVLKI